MLWVLRDARTIERLVERVALWRELLSRLSDESPDDTVTLLRCLYWVVGEESFERLRQRIIEVAPATEGPMATAAEQLIQRGKAQGKAEGKAEGVLAIFEAVVWW